MRSQKLSAEQLAARRRIADDCFEIPPCVTKRGMLRRAKAYHIAARELYAAAERNRNEAKELRMLGRSIQGLAAFAAECALDT